MDATRVLWIFVVLKLVYFVFERFLARKNRSYYLDETKQREAKSSLSISDENMEKTLSYSEDKYKFANIVTAIKFVVFVFFLTKGGFGWIEDISKSYFSTPVTIGLGFFLILGGLSFAFNLPFDYLKTFHLEDKHGFNKSTVATFIKDRLKGIVIGGLLGGLLLSGILWIMESLTYWWLWAWVLMTSFSLLTMFIYPTVLAPLFNKFSDVPEGELKEQIDVLANKVGFNHSGISIMNASMRSSHGNAYFTGVFGKKKIVLFDTLVEALSPKQVVAVLAHELGHFKLNHVRWSFIRSIFTTGLMFYLLSLCLPYESFYSAFFFDGISNYGALVVFSMWFGLADILLQPFESFLSRKNEFAADKFAKENYESGAKYLKEGLLKLRETSNAMPISHPWFSSYYYSHPPMIERLKAIDSL